jgi:hypothetical protein
MGHAGCRYRIQGAGYRIQGVGCRIQGAGFKVQDSGRVTGYWIQGAGFRIQGAGCRAVTEDRLPGLILPRQIIQNLFIGRGNYPCGIVLHKMQFKSLYRRHTVAGIVANEPQSGNRLKIRRRLHAGGIVP